VYKAGKQLYAVFCFPSLGILLKTINDFYLTLNLIVNLAANFGKMKRALQNFVTQLVPVYREINYYKRVIPKNRDRLSNTFKN
jgi:hypothetical protein